MPHQVATAYTVSPSLLGRQEFRDACLARNFAEVFRLMRQYDGASQERTAAPVEGLTQSRVSRIIRGEDHIASLDLIERIVDGLRIPGSYFGLAPREWEDLTVSPAPTTPVTPAAELTLESGSDVVDKHMSVRIDIAPDGAAKLLYRHELHNATSTPFTRLTRQFWFKHTTGPIRVEPVADAERSVFVQRLHDVGYHMKFACQVMPAIQPGETGVVSYTCEGGRFVDELYWRTSVYRPTERLSLSLRLHGVPMLTGCSAVEERPDGSEISATESLSLAREDGGLVLDIERHYLRPNQSVTIRWELPSATA